jgi:hypothetical protein
VNLVNNCAMGASSAALTANRTISAQTGCLPGRYEQVNGSLRNSRTYFSKNRSTPRQPRADAATAHTPPSTAIFAGSPAKNTGAMPHQITKRPKARSHA